MKFHIQLLIIIVIVVAGGCSHRLNEDQSAMKKSSNEEISMPAYEQLPALKNDAMAGSPKAAMQLSLWYMQLSEKEADLYWTRIGAENGSVAGQYNLGLVLLSDSSNPLNNIRGRYWLTKSAKQGNQWAIEKLAELDQGKK